jgi:hypothetical protein
MKSKDGKPEENRVSPRSVWLTASLFVVVLALIYVSVEFPSPKRFIRVLLDASSAGAMQVYFDNGEGLSEDQSAVVSYGSGSNRLSLALPDGKLKGLRFDPSLETRWIRLHAVSIEGPRIDSKVELPLSAIYGYNEIQSVASNEPGTLIKIESPATDPFFFLSLGQPVDSPCPQSFIAVVKNILMILALVLFLLLICKPLSRVPAPAWLLAPLVLVITMAAATTTSRSIHPDEYSHVSASRYYFAHWRPPGADNPLIAESYTPYGTSYLNEFDVVYFIAAKTSAAWEHIVEDDTLGLRVFNVVLFALLILVGWLKRSAWVGAAVLLMSPQIWYLFSYFNADALPLFLSFLLVFLYASPQSNVSTYIDQGRGGLWEVATFVLVLGLILVSKRNYLPVVLVTGLFLSARHLRVPLWSITAASLGAAFFVLRFAANLNIEGLSLQVTQLLIPVGTMLMMASGIGLALNVRRIPELRPKCVRLFALFFIACLIAFPRLALDRAANGDSVNKQRTLQVMAEMHAIPALKPSAISKGTDASLPGHNLAEKGVGLLDIFRAPHEWAYQSWKSMLGVYGYMDISTPTLLYLMMSGGMLLCAFRAGLSAMQEAEFRSYFFIAICGMALTVLSSMVYSWVVDLQPQGRYLLPCMPIAAAVLMSNRSLARSPVVWTGVTISFFAALYSFFAYGIPQLVVR